MEKSRECGLILDKDIEVEYVDLLSKSKLKERDFQKEIMKMKILYQSEKSKSSSLENSMKEYPLRLTALEERLNEEILLRKSLESSLEKYSNEEKSVAEKLQNYEQACSLLQSQYASLNQKHLDTLKDKNELQQNLTEYIAFLNNKTEKLKEDHEKAIEDLKFEENQKRVQENKELRKEIAYLSSKISNKKEQFSRISQKFEDSKDFQFKIAVEVDKKESEIRNLKRQNEKLLERSYTLTGERCLDLDDISDNLDKIRTENSQLKRTLRNKEDKFYKEEELLLEEIDTLKHEIEKLNRKKTKFETENKNLHSKVFYQSQTIQDLQGKLSDWEDGYNEVKKQTKQSIEPVMIKLITERDSFRVQLQEARRSIECSPAPSVESSLYEELSNLNHQTPELLEIELSRTLEEKEDLEKELSITLERKNELEIELSETCEKNEELVKEIMSINLDLSDKIDSISDLETKIKELTVQENTARVLRIQLSEKDEMISDLRTINKELKENLEKMASQITEIDGAIDRMKKEKLNSQEKLKSVESELKQKEMVISEIQRKNQDLQKEVELLQQLSSKLNKKNLEITPVPEAETEIKRSISTEDSFSSRNSEESESNSERLHSEILEKESLISDLNREKQELSNQIHTLQKENTDLSCQISLQVIHPRYTGKKGIAAILELESERDMLKSEILRLETQLQLSTQEWTVYSNQLYEELVKEHDQKLDLIEKTNLQKSHKSIKHSVSAKTQYKKF